MSEPNPEPWEVWELFWEYPDRPGEGKRRPVIIGQCTDPDYMVIYVTSQVTKYEGKRGCVVVQEWRRAGLTKPSLINTGRRLMVRKNNLIRRMGRLYPSDIIEVQLALLR